MKKRLISMFLVLVMALESFPISAFAASSTIAGALGEVNITNGGYKMSYLSMNGVVRSQSYTYFNFKSASGAIKEIPAYCINPTTKGVPCLLYTSSWSRRAMDTAERRFTSNWGNSSAARGEAEYTEAPASLTII